jgi:hypothetical protein
LAEKGILKNCGSGTLAETKMILIMIISSPISKSLNREVLKK